MSSQPAASLPEFPYQKKIFYQQDDMRSFELYSSLVKSVLILIVLDRLCV